MIRISDKSLCSGCHACAAACPKQCIEMKQDVQGFLYPEVTAPDACVSCGLCEKVCPVLSGQCQSAEAKQVCYAAMNREDSVRSVSSSGGVFDLLAGAVLAEGGAVVGAALMPDMLVSHVIAESEAELSRLRGSKYLQSRIGSVYSETKALLQQGRPVLFSGTPCQIGGLLAYLGKPYDNLITQDIVCHGVPSPKVWQAYVHAKEQAAGSKAKAVRFRDKSTGWKHYSVAVDFENGQCYRSRCREDPYMQGFLANLYLRPSCYHCAFKTVQRQSDLTLADFWGVQKVLPEMDDDRGTSIVWIHTEKGQALFSKIQDALKCQTVSAEQFVSHNPSAIRCAEKTAKSAEFWESFQGEFPFQAVQKLTKKPAAERCKRFLRRVQKKLFPK